MPTAFLRLLPLVLLFGWMAPARAHDPYESWTEAILSADRLELIVTMAQSTALKLVDPDARIAELTAANFPALRERFTQTGGSLFVVTSVRTPLVAREVKADLTEENDVVFKIILPRPAPGRLHFHAAFLRKLGDGYGGLIDVGDKAGRQLGWEQISWDLPNFEVNVPAGDPPAKVTPPTPTPPAALPAPSAPAGAKP